MTFVSTRKTGPPPLIVRFVAPGPVRVRDLLMISPPLMTPITVTRIKSPGAPSAKACRNEPGPVSLVFTTTSARCTTVSTAVSLVTEPPEFATSTS